MSSAFDTIVQLADRRVDLVRQQVLHADGAMTALTTREAELLAYLFARAEQDVSREELLEHVWEYRASYATRAVDVAMRRLRSKVEADPSDPVHLISVHGVGYRFVPAAADARAAFHTPAPPPPRTTNLRGDRSSFIGREQELARIGELFGSGARLVSVLGPGGVGKTRLAMAAGRQAAAQHDAVWWVDLTDARGVDGVLAAVGRVLNLPLTASDLDEQIDQVGRSLAGRRRVLMLLDNVEHLVDSAVAVVGRWLGQAPHVRWLVTSRARLRVQGEQVIELSPLPPADARRLFVERARAVGAELDVADAVMVDRITHKLDGLPLAIELAAPRARVLSLEQLLDRLAQRFRVLASPPGADAGPARQSTLRLAIDGSWQLLDDHERSVLAQCSVFVGGFTLEAAESVVVLPDGAPWALDVLESLRDKSLLRIDEPDDLPGELRFGMYESIREYAAERLAELGSTAEVERRHAETVVRLAFGLVDRVEAHGGLASFRQLAVEADNLLAAHARTRDDEPSLALAAVLALGPVLRVRGPASLYLRLLDDALDVAAELGEPETMARLLLDRGRLRRVAAQLEAARRDVGEVLILVKHAASPIEVDALLLLAQIHSDQARGDEAEVIARAALERAEELGLARLRGELTGIIATFRAARGQSEDAEAGYVDAMRTLEACGQERGQASVLANLAQLYGDRRRLDAAEEHVRRALQIHAAWGDRRGRAQSLMTLAGVHVRAGRYADAAAAAGEAKQIFDELGVARLSAIATTNLATLRWAAGEAVDDAAFIEPLQTHRSTGDRALEAITLGYLAARAALRGDVGGAEALLAEADDRLRGYHMRQTSGIVAVARGFVELARARAATGDVAQAHRAAAAERAAHGSSSDVLGVSFFAGLLERELRR